MNSKQVVAVVSIVALLFIIVYPAFSTGTILVLVRSMKIENAEHIYVTVNAVRAHRSGVGSSEGWELVSNESRKIDLVSLANQSMSLEKGQVSVAKYDTIRIEVSNITWVYNKTTTKLAVDFSQLPASIDFAVNAGRQSVITLVLTGHQENRLGTKFFVSNLNATLTET